MGTVESAQNERLGWIPVDTAIAKFAHKFWGVDTGQSLIPIPQTTEYKLEYLRKTLAIAPNLDRPMQSWVDGKRLKTVPSIYKVVKQELLPPEGAQEKLGPLPKTVQQAFRIPEIGGSLHDQLATQQSPVEYIFQRYMGYAEYIEYVDDPILESAHTVGNIALELFLFAASGDGLAKQVQINTVEFYEKQLAIIAASTEQPPVTQQY